MRQLRFVFVFVVASVSVFGARAQYYDMANQLTSMLSPALSGSLRYRGFADVSYVAGVGHNGCDFLEVTATQGFKYGSWFFMGVGAGVDVMFSGYKDSDRPTGWQPSSWGNGYNASHRSGQTGVLIPLYSDFRFDIGSQRNLGAFLDIRVGASFLVGRSYINTPDGVLNNSEGFYLKPSVGMRIPVNDGDERQAINISASYQLVSTNYWDWSGWYGGTTVNAVGVSIGYEW